MSAAYETIPWEQIKIDYITGFRDGEHLKKHSYDTIARKYGVSTSAVSDRGAREGWKRERDEYEMDVSEMVLEGIKSDRVQKITTLDDNLLNNVRMIQSIITGKLTTDDKITGNKKLKTNINTGELQKITSMVLNLATVRKSLFVDLTDNSKSEGLKEFARVMDKLEIGDDE